MKIEIRDFVGNPNDPDLQGLYDAINDLVDNAGHITIEDLFTKSPSEIEQNAWRSIQRAKDYGIFASPNNHSCCVNNECVPCAQGYCNRTNNGGCSLMSHACSQVGE